MLRVHESEGFGDEARYVLDGRILEQALETRRIVFAQHWLITAQSTYSTVIQQHSNKHQQEKKHKHTTFPDEHEHGHDEIVHKGQTLPVGKNRVPQPQYVFQVELTSEQQPHPASARWVGIKQKRAAEERYRA